MGVSICDVMTEQARTKAEATEDKLKYLIISSTFLCRQTNRDSCFPSVECRPFRRENSSESKDVPRWGRANLSITLLP